MARYKKKDVKKYIINLNIERKFGFENSRIIDYIGLFIIILFNYFLFFKFRLSLFYY